ncbi:uncharacterized protein B0I36DRAFT_68255 [Microdochium trichocladiopsis]|uniref:Secreted protein n=1 Tax=Microdochium trichocladiopsis TaxID=1682393 RepID=A0A9P9BU08_9PEZI|nr:uncharacterized protein B0I36DRAFT_68255 [Microdochium trichocladiopsis]KAH7037587.1 hypothetical protein B0I36DRAFT_68255 [Microdochium trichocladiopsis]
MHRVCLLVLRASAASHTQAVIYSMPSSKPPRGHRPLSPVLGQACQTAPPLPALAGRRRRRRHPETRVPKLRNSQQVVF